MFRNLTTVIAMTVLSLASGRSQAAEFKEFSPAGVGFKVQMPGTPKEKEVTAAGVQAKMFIAEEKDGAYVISYADIPIPGNESPAQVQTRLDGARDGQLRNMGGKLVSESKIQLGGQYPGRNIYVDVPGKQMYAHTQIFLVDKRLYQVLAIGTKSWVKSADAKKFFKSFALTAK